MGYNFLIVDDSSIVRKVLIKTLKLTDIDIASIFQAENGRQGLSLVRTAKIDLIFLDINMPVMNGIEFMDKLRQDEANRDTPVIVVSTEGSKERKEQLFARDIKAYLRKPVTPEVLTEMIHQVLEARE